MKVLDHHLHAGNQQAPNTITKSKLLSIGSIWMQRNPNKWHKWVTRMNDPNEIFISSRGSRINFVRGRAARPSGTNNAEKKEWFREAVAENCTVRQQRRSASFTTQSDRAHLRVLSSGLWDTQPDPHVDLRAMWIQKMQSAQN